VVLGADLFEQRELGFEPVDVLLFVLEDLFEQVAAVVVAELAAGLDAFVEARQRFHLQRVVRLHDLGHVLTDVDLAEALDVGDALEEQHALDQLLGMFHLADGVLADDPVQAIVAPVLAHLAVHEILIDRGELRGQNVVEDLDDLRVTLHGVSVSRPYYAMAGTAGCAAGTQAGQAARSAAVTASIARSELWQEPHWSPMPQRCRSRRLDAPLSMAWRIFDSEAPRQMQTIMS